MKQAKNCNPQKTNEVNSPQQAIGMSVPDAISCASNGGKVKQFREIEKILTEKKPLHFIGVGGSGMYPLVQILLTAGHKISGSDVNKSSVVQSEIKQGVLVKIGHHAENVHGAGLVVYSAAIPKTNPERMEAEKLNITCIERSIMLGYISSLYKRPLCIAGTHGKTTVTGMSTQILQMAGLNPAAVIGGRLPLINGYGKAGCGDGIVIEACEYHNTFLQLCPETAVLLNVDNDHLEFFGSMDNLKEAFRKFCLLTSGAVIYNGDDKNSCEVVKNINKKLISFGLTEACDIRAVQLKEHKPSFWAFKICENGNLHDEEILLSSPGKHNVYNALAAYAGATRLGATHFNCTVGLAAFKGTGRRFEILGMRSGITIVDDYAHHPAELEAVLTAAMKMNFSSVWAVFQPYTYSRTQMLLDDFAKVLPIADKVVMTAIMGGRENSEDYDITTQNLADKMPNSVWRETQEEVAAYVMQNAKKGDLVITLGCGDIYKCAHMMLAGN